MAGKSYGGYDPTDEKAMEKAVKANPPKAKLPNPPGPKKKAGSPKKGTSTPKKSTAPKKGSGGGGGASKNWWNVLFGGRGRYVTSGNGYKNRPSGVRYELGYHTGVDFGARQGIKNNDPIYFPAKSGVVTDVSTGGPLGKTVVVRMNNGHYVSFSHMSNIAVASGQRVTAGTRIGRVGSSGTNSSGPHLHIEVRTPSSGGRWGRGNFVDPVSFFRGQGGVKAGDPAAGGGGTSGGGGGGGGGGSWGGDAAGKMASYLMSKGLSAEGAAAVVGNLKVEAPGLNPATVGDGGHSYGLAQWNTAGGRRAAFESYMKSKGHKLSDWKGQLDYVMVELKRDYPGLHKSLVKGGDAGSLAVRFMQEYERPADSASNGPNARARSKAAAGVYKTYNPGASPSGDDGGSYTYGTDSDGNPTVTYTNSTSGGGGGGGGGGGTGFSKKKFYADLESNFGDIDTLLAMDKEARKELGGKSLKWAIDEMVRKKIVDPSIALTYLNKTAWFKKYSPDITKKLVMEESKPELAATEQDQRRASIEAGINAAGVQLSPEDIQKITRDAWVYSWTPEQVDRAIARASSVALSGGDYAAQTEELYAYADDFGIDLSEPMQRQWQQDFLSKKGAEAVKTLIRQQAAARYPVFAERLDSGQSLRSVTDAYFQKAAELLEVDPNSIDWNDPLFAGGKAFVTTDQNGQQTQRALAEFEKNVRQDSRWVNTNNAREELTNGAYGLLQRFGMVG